MPALPTLTPEATLPDVRTAIADGARTLLELRATPADKRGPTFEADVREAAAFIHDTDLVARALEHAERAANPAGQSRGGRTPGADLDIDRPRSMGAQVTEHEAYADWAKRGGRSTGAFVIEVRNLIGGFSAGVYDSGADGFLPVGSPVYVPQAAPRRQVFLRSLMSVQGTGLRVVPYLRELNPFTTESGAEMTSEGSAKAEVTATFENHSAIIEKITAWIPATDEILTDAPTLRGYIDTRLTYMLDIREDDQIINGNGTSPQITGLETVSGTQTQTSATGDYPVAIGKAIGQVENVYGAPNGVATNPLDYWAAVVKRQSTQFDNSGTGLAPAQMAGITWGLEPARTRAVTAGKAYVGDWQIGATFFDRQETTVKVGDQHSDNFVRNILVILAEKRVGVAWHRPDLFVKVTVPTS